MPSRLLRVLLLGFFVLCGHLVGLIADNAPSTSPTFDQIRTPAEAGDLSSQLELAKMYDTGQGVPQDYAQSFAWCLKAANQGQVDAEFHVAYMYSKGEGTGKDATTAFQWYLKAAKQGAALAELAVGSDYYYGMGTAKDISQAEFWLQKAALQGNTDAQILLGVAYLMDKNSPENLRMGFTYLLHNAKENGYAAYWIACCYRNGFFVSADPVLAYMWGLHASSLSTSDDLSKFMAYLKATLTDDQIHDAEQRLANLPPLLDGHIQNTDLTTTFTQGTSSLIHFKFELNGILIPIQTPNQQTAYLMFDTGSEESIISKDFAANIGARGNTYLPTSGIGENLSLATVSDSMTFSIPGLTFGNARFSILPDVVFDEESGQPVVGILGLDLVKNLVVCIDYINQTIEFIQPESFRPQDAKGVCLPIAINQLGPIVEATVINDQLEAKGNFLVDTGDAGSISITKSFQDRNPALKFKALTSTGTSGLGGIMLSSIGTCSAFKFGDLNLTSPKLYLDQSIHGLAVELDGGTIGNDIWRRFDLTLDLPEKKLYLQKNANFSDPYSYTSAGMHVMASGAHYETLTVHEVLPTSPSALAGFQTGDVLVKLDELGNDLLTMENVYPLLHKPGTYHFLVQRNGQNITLILKLEDPIAKDPNASR